MKYTSLLLGTTALVGSSFTAALAQQDEIIVTATKREQTLQEIPIAVSVTDGEVIDRANISDLSDLQSVVPTLRVNQLQSSTQTNFIIRGFGNGANNAGIEPSVGVYIDGVYRSRSASQINDLPDLQRVEVLRGPQSTLFGKNASAGVISVVTKAPTLGETSGWLEVGAGNFSARTAKGKINFPLGETAAASIYGSINRRDGYITNNTLGNQTNDRDRWSLRGDIAWEPTDRLSFRLIGDVSEIDEVCCGAGLIIGGPTVGAVAFAAGLPVDQALSPDPLTHRVNFDTDPVSQVEASGLSLQGEYDFAGATLTSITSYRAAENFFDIDVDFSAADIANQITDREFDTFTQELRLTSTGDGPIAWMVGGFYFDEEIDQEDNITYGTQFDPFISALLSAAGTSTAVLEGLLGVDIFAPGQFDQVLGTQDNQAFSVFGTLDWEISDRLTASFGINYTEDEKSFTVTQNSTETASTFDFDFSGALGFAPQDGTAGTPLPAAGGLSLGDALAVEAAGGAANIAALTMGAAMGDFVSIATLQAIEAGTNDAINGLKGIQFLPRYPGIPNAQEDGRTDDDDVTYTARLAFDVTDNVNIYGSFATGFKATSINLSRDSRPEDVSGFSQAEFPNLSPGSRSAGPEEAEVFELGLKAKWDTVSLNVAIFDQTIDNFQSNVFQGASFNLVNAGQQSTEGVEWDLLWTPTDNFTFGFAGTVLDPVYNSFTGAAVVPGSAADARLGAPDDGVGDLSGEQVAGIHEQSMSFSAMYDWEGDRFDGYVRADYQYESDVRTNDNTPASISREVNTLNAAAGISKGGLELSVWGRNLTDDSYITTSFPTVAQTGSFSGYPNQPRTYGVSLKASF